MNFETNIQQTVDWITEVNKTVTKKSGQFTAQDKLGNQVILEWHKTNMLSAELASLMADAWGIAHKAYPHVEVKFLQEFPEVVEKEPIYKSYEPYFKVGIDKVDWQAVQKETEFVLKRFFIFNPAQFPEHLAKMMANDISFFVSIKDANSKSLLGFITFLIRPDYKHGDVKVTTMAVDPTLQNRGLAKLLMSSIIKIVPDLKRIFLCTRVTNDTALRAYRSWGFINETNPTQDPHYKFNLDHWTFMEYDLDKSDILQNTAKSMVELT